MDFEVGMDVLFCAQRQHDEEMLFERWIHQLSDISFDDFKDSVGFNRPHEPEKSQSQILDSVKKIMGG